MKHLNKIIGALLILILTFHTAVPITYAVTAEEKCSGKKPVYDDLLKAWQESPQDESSYKAAFEKAQLAHHGYVGCMFDFAERTILKSDGASDSGTMNANTLNTGGIPVFSTLVDWMSPNEACLTQDELKKLVQATEPSVLLSPILKAYANYRDHLDTLGEEFDGSGIVLDSNAETLSDKIDIVNTYSRQRKMEIQSALMVIDLMFTSLKELRLSFVMHVQFQCMLKFLEKYRKALEELRNVIEPLPALLKDASITK